MTTAKAPVLSTPQTTSSNRWRGGRSRMSKGPGTGYYFSPAFHCRSWSWETQGRVLQLLLLLSGHGCGVPNADEVRGFDGVCFPEQKALAILPGSALRLVKAPRPDWRLRRSLLARASRHRVTARSSLEDTRGLSLGDVHMAQAVAADFGFWCHGKASWDSMRA